MLLQFEDIAFIGDLQEEFLHVIGRCSLVGHKRIERRVGPVGLIEARPPWSIVFMRGGQKIDKPPHLREGDDVVIIGRIGEAADFGMKRGAAKRLKREIFSGQPIGDFGSGNAKCVVSETMKMKSISFAAKASPPMQGPMTTAICGMMPAASTWFRTISP